MPDHRSFLRCAALVVLSSIPLLGGCSGIQSAMNPQGPAAERIAQLAWVMFTGAGVILALVLVLLALSLWLKPKGGSALRPNWFIGLGGVALPVVTLSALLVYALLVGADIESEPDQAPLVVEVTAHQWWWEFTYVEDGARRQVKTANELHIPAGRPVSLRLSSSDVIHSFWLPNLAGKRDIIPGSVNRLRIEADEPGLFRGQCNEFCGAQHTLMSLYVVSEPAKAFDAWLSRQAEPAAQPDTVALQEGRADFMASGCALCHTIRGTDAKGRVAPDLTHFASRRSIGAATLENTRGNVEAWIASAQHIKPGTRMPSFDVKGDTLKSIAIYLESLE